MPTVSDNTLSSGDVELLSQQFTIRRICYGCDQSKIDRGYHQQVRHEIHVAFSQCNLAFEPFTLPTRSKIEHPITEDGSLPYVLCLVWSARANLFNSWVYFVPLDVFLASSSSHLQYQPIIPRIIPHRQEICAEIPSLPFPLDPRGIFKTVVLSSLLS